MGLFLIATAAGCEVGIDIERHRPIEDLEALVHTIASHAEQAAWEALATVSRQQAFYRLWTRKEAYLKAIGLGLFRNLQAVTVPVTPMDLSQAVLVNDCGESLPWPCWRLCDLPAWEGFSAALCWQSSDSASHPLPEMTIQDLSANDLSAGYLA